ncbi:MAG: response regulator [Acidobacteria bacterium]|nr:response regulator [Acidobacteriota bacterium]
MNQKVLLVMTPARRLPLLKLLENAGFQVFSAGGCREAQQKLDSAVSVDLVCVDAELPDGNWRDVLRSIFGSRKQCEVIVCSRCGDERLWADVLQCGAYDLIVEPYTERETLRICQRALDARYMERFVQAPAARAS